MAFFSSNNPNAKLGKSLEKTGIAKEVIRDSLRQADTEQRPLTEILFEHPSVTPAKILGVLAEHFALPVVNLRERRIAPQVLRMIPKEVAEEHSVILFKKRKNDLKVATATPEDTEVISFIERTTGCTAEMHITSPQDINHALQLYDSVLEEDLSEVMADTDVDPQKSELQLAEDAPTIKTVNSIIERALHQKASDIHLEPQQQRIVVRFRVDGMLRKVAVLRKTFLAPIVARVKLLSGLKIDEHRTAQDGRFQYSYRKRDVAIRVSMIPTLNGTKVVMRLLDTATQRFTLRKLGFNDRDYALLRDEIKMPQGMILVTGPTGSGKTTTLYTILHLMNKENVNIATIEDPIEYGIEGINQTQINPAAKLTFANGLRSLLRQDPNILMVGEIRDLESAEIAMNAAMTGHLVLSTLHTNSAFLAPQRLMDMGVPAFLVSSVLNLTVGQRLVRRICTHCKRAARSPKVQLERFAEHLKLKDVLRTLKDRNLIPDSITRETIKLSEGRGCAKCGDAGFQGRIAVCELMQSDPELNSLIMARAPEQRIEDHARSAGSISLLEDGILKVLKGETTLAEVSRATRE